MQQRARNGILDSQHTDGRWVFLDVFKHLLDSATADELYLLSLEVEVRRNVVERPDESLYGYSLHLIYLRFADLLLYKKLRFHLVCEAEPYFIFYLFTFLLLLTTHRFTIACKVKVIAVKVSVVIQHRSIVLLFSAAKV